MYAIIENGGKQYKIEEGKKVRLEKFAGAEGDEVKLENVLAVNMGEATLIGEVGIESAISYRKGCYLGQEVVERVAARGHVQRKRVGLVCAGNCAPPPDAKLLHDGKEVGAVTSAAYSPLRQQVVAMGYVRREAWEDGTVLDVRWDDGEATATVCALPFPPG